MKIALLTVATTLVFLSMTGVFAQENKEYTLKLDGASLVVISKALGAMPFNEVYSTIVMLQKQVSEQNMPKHLTHVTPPTDTPPNAINVKPTDK